MSIPVELRPHAWVENIRAINFCRLAELGRTHVLLDVDNTTCLRNSTVIEADTLHHLNTMREQGAIQAIALLSNVGVWTPWAEGRIRAIAESIDTPHYVCAYWPQIKPRPAPFLRAMALIGGTPHNTVIVGDQVFTDVRGGNRLGLYTVLVDPLGPDNWVTFWKRSKQQRVLRHLERCGVL